MLVLKFEECVIRKRVSICFDNLHGKEIFSQCSLPESTKRLE